VVVRSILELWRFGLLTEGKLCEIGELRTIGLELMAIWLLRRGMIVGEELVQIGFLD
jgi:hypothetical protein